MSKLFKASFPDRLPSTDRLPLNYMSPLVIHDRPTATTIRAMNKRDAWQKLHNQYPYERIVIEEVKDA